MAAAGGAAPFESEYPDPACEQAEQGPVAVNNYQVAVEQAVGRWILCGGIFPFGRSEPGFDIAADGNLYMLKETSPGHFERRLTLGDHGSWMIRSSDGVVFELDLLLVTGGVYGFPTFATSPRKVHFTQMAGESTYILAP